MMSEPEPEAEPPPDMSDFEMETIRDSVPGYEIPFAVFVAALIILTLLVMR